MNKCLYLSTERDPTLRIKYSRKHPMFSDDGPHHQHKKLKISADDYAARSNELYERNLFTDMSRLSENSGESSHRHGSSSKHLSSSKHDHHSSQHGHHHSSSHHKHEQKKQLKVDFCVKHHLVFILYSYVRHFTCTL